MIPESGPLQAEERAIHGPGVGEDPHGVGGNSIVSDLDWTSMNADLTAEDRLHCTPSSQCPLPDVRNRNQRAHEDGGGVQDFIVFSRALSVELVGFLALYGENAPHGSFALSGPKNSFRAERRVWCEVSLASAAMGWADALRIELPRALGLASCPGEFLHLCWYREQHATLGTRQRVIQHDRKDSTNPPTVSTVMQWNSARHSWISWTRMTSFPPTTTETWPDRAGQTEDMSRFNRCFYTV